MNFKDIFIVIVLYKTTLEESKTIQTLVEAVGQGLNLLVFDNSPERQYENDNFDFKNFKVQYYHNGTNPGLSVAYNYALDLAKKFNYSWLLLLDQDTSFTKSYIQEIEKIEMDVLSNSVVAILPKVTSEDNNKIISPTKMYLGGVCRSINVKAGQINIPISGINSGTMLRVSYMNSINGFSEKYSLDMLDHWYFRKIFDDKKSVFVLSSNIIQNLSVFGNFEENVSFARYQQMLKSELLFIREEGILSLLVFKARLIFRTFKQLKYKNKEYYKFTVSQL